MKYHKDINVMVARHNLLFPQYMKTAVRSKNPNRLPFLMEEGQEPHFTFDQSRACSKHRRGHCSSRNRHIGEK